MSEEHLARPFQRYIICWYRITLSLLGGDLRFYPKDHCIIVLHYTSYVGSMKAYSLPDNVILVDHVNQLIRIVKSKCFK